MTVILFYLKKEQEIKSDQCIRLIDFIEFDSKIDGIYDLLKYLF